MLLNKLYAPWILLNPQSRKTEVHPKPFNIPCYLLPHHWDKKCLMETHYRRRNLSWLPVSEEQSVIMGKAWQSIFRGSQSLRRQLIHSGGLANWERIVGGAGLYPSRHCYMAWCLAGRPCFRGATTSLNNAAVWGPNLDSNHTGALAS